MSSKQKKKLIVKQIFDQIKKYFDYKEKLFVYLHLHLLRKIVCYDESSRTEWIDYIIIFIL